MSVGDRIERSRIYGDHFYLILQEIGRILSVMVLRAILATVLAALSTAAAEDSLPAHVLQLQRIKLHMREELRRQPDYTCLQTTARYRKERPDFELLRYDTLLLEILTSGKNEFYGPPGARDFLTDNPAMFAAGGMSGTGIFALFAGNLFVQDAAVFDYRGEEEILGRRTVRYDYRVPQFQSGWTISSSGVIGAVGMKGAFWADPTTLDVIRLRVDAAEIPPELDVRATTQLIEYARTRIGAGDVLLPQNAVVELQTDVGATSRNIIEFTHCRAFSATSSVSFEGDKAPAARKAAVETALPARLTIAIELATELAASDAVGKLIEGRVAADVVLKKKVLVPAGAAVYGRLRRLEHQTGYFGVGLEFTQIDLPSGPARFYAVLEDITEKGPIQFTRPGGKVEETYLPDVAGVASFFVKGERLELPKNLRTVWTTREAR
jgi:hypothetical protein